MKIVVLAGGLSPERDVSLSSGTKIAAALRGLGHKVALVDMYFGLEDYPGLTDPQGLYAVSAPEAWEKVKRSEPDLAAVRASRKWQGKSEFGPGVLELCQDCDVVFLAFHGQCGEDGRVQAAFDLLGIPYTGAGYLSNAIAMDKDLTKRLVRGEVPTPDWQLVEYTEGDIDALTRSIEVPCVVKPVDSGSSIGVSIVHDSAALRGALELGLRHGGKCVIEKFIKGREFSVGVLDGKALPPIEIVPKVGFYDYENKYQAGATEEICPAPLSDEDTATLQRYAEKVFTIIGLSVYSRIDFMRDEEGKFWLLEANTLPGMTPTSLLPQEAAAVGMDYPTLCQHIIESSLGQNRRG